LRVRAAERLFTRMSPDMVIKFASLLETFITYCANKRPFVIFKFRHREGGSFRLYSRGGWLLKIRRSQLVAEAREGLINMARILRPIISASPVLMFEKCAFVKSKTSWILPRTCCRLRGVEDGRGQMWNFWRGRHFQLTQILNTEKWG
jgi:hypothetical protein